jgi:hypothetical protein
MRVYMRIIPITIEEVGRNRVSLRRLRMARRTIKNAPRPRQACRHPSRVGTRSPFLLILAVNASEGLHAHTI